MNIKTLESSEFYDKRFRNFATLLVIPMFALFLLVILFSLFARKELIIKSVGELEPVSSLQLIQSTSSNVITNFDLTEGKTVRRGQIILRYQDTDDRDSIKSLLIQRDDLSGQIEALNRLKDGVNSNTNTFSKPDKYGFSSILEDYLNQRRLTITQGKINTDTAQATKNAYSAQRKLLTTLVTRNTKQLNNDNEVLNAIKKGSSVSSSNSQKYLYNSYTAQVSGLSSADKDQVKAQTINNLQTEIDQLQSNIDSYESQKAQLITPKSIDDLEVVGQTQLASLRASALSSAKKKLTEAEETLATLKLKINASDNDDKDNNLRVKKDGVLHLLVPPKIVEEYIPKGTEIAEIYPKLSSQSKLLIKSYVVSTDATNVKVGQKTRYRLMTKTPKPFTLTGNISKISVATDSLKNQSAYEVYSVVKVNKSEIKNLRYDLQGTVYYITGSKTYFEYFYDKIRGVNNN